MLEPKNTMLLKPCSASYCLSQPGGGRRTLELYIPGDVMPGIELGLATCKPYSLIPILSLQD